MVKKILKKVRKRLIGIDLDSIHVIERQIAGHLESLDSHLRSLEQGTNSRLASIDERLETFAIHNHHSHHKWTSDHSQFEKRLSQIEKRLHALSMIAGQPLNGSMAHSGPIAEPDLIQQFSRSVVERFNTTCSISTDTFGLENCVPRDAKVLDLSFNLSVASTIATQVSTYLALNSSPALVEFAKNQFLKVKGLQFAELTEANVLSLGTRRFDLVLALFEPHNWSIEKVEKCLAIAAKALAPNGRLIVGIPISKGDCHEIGWNLAARLEALGVPSVSDADDNVPEALLALGIKYCIGLPSTSEQLVKVVNGSDL